MKKQRAKLKCAAKSHALEYIRKPYRKKMDAGDVENILRVLVNNVSIDEVFTALHNVCCHGDAHTLSKIALPDEKIERLLSGIIALRDNL